MGLWVTYNDTEWGCLATIKKMGSFCDVLKRALVGASRIPKYGNKSWALDSYHYACVPFPLALNFVFWGALRLLSKVIKRHQGQVVVKRSLKVNNGPRASRPNPKREGNSLGEIQALPSPSPGTSVLPQVNTQRHWQLRWSDTACKPYQMNPSYVCHEIKSKKKKKREKEKNEEM